MRPAWFIGLNVSGTVARLFALRVLGDVFSDPIDTVLSWIGDNRLWLTAVTVVIVMATVMLDRLQGGGDLEGISELAEDPEPDPSAPAAEAHEVQPAPPPARITGSLAWPWRVALGLGLAALLAAVAVALVVRNGGDDDSDGALTGRASPGVLAEPTRPDVRRLSGAGGCEEWADGARAVRCEVGGDVAWLVAEVADEWRVELLRPVDGQRWAVDLVAAEPGGTWQDVRAVATDAGGPTGHEVLVGFRHPGSGGLLVVELVDRGGLAVHGELEQGRARLSATGLETWEAIFAPDDPTCCPSAFRRDVVAWADGSWQVVETTEVPADEVPESHV